MGRNRLTQAEFENRVRKAHEGKYYLSKAQYERSDKKLEVVCPEHGSWWITPSNLFRKKGCPKCTGKKGPKRTGIGGRRCNGRMKLTQAEFENRVRSLYGDIYDFSNVIYAGVHKKIMLVCTQHGEFFITPNKLFCGCSCPKCGYEKMAKQKFLGQQEFENRILSLFGEKADCSDAIYRGKREKVTMRCAEHDIEFETTPDSLFTGAWGCPKCCRSRKSKGEDSVAEYIESLGVKVERGRRDVIPPRELDIFIPEKNLAVEYNGVYYHSESRLGKAYHYQKFKMCRERGIRLIQFTDILWQTRQNQIKSFLSNALGVIASDKKIDTRNCEVRLVKVGELREFLNTNHIRGHCHTGSIALALFSGSEIVSAMVFGKGTNQRGAARKEKEAVWTLSRYATSCVVRGGFGKLLKHGRDLIGWGHDIVSFSANDYFAGRAYEAAGFELDAEIAPDYQVYHPRNGLRPKSHWQRRHIPARLAEVGWEGSFDPETDPRTEWEIEDEVGAVRVYDSGKIRWRLRGVDKSHRAV